jgi:long-chain acyl-CoA synthetase
MIKENFTGYLLDSIVENWEKSALTDYQGESFSYAEIASLIKRFHAFYRLMGIAEGDKVALVGKNSARWGIVYISVVTYGAVIVPVLPDFRENDLHEIIRHSDSVLLFAGDFFRDKIAFDKVPAIRATISLETFEAYQAENQSSIEAWGECMHATEELEKKDFIVPLISGEKLAVISYTSGTTGNAKGVMLNHNTLAANVRYARANMPLNPGDPIVSFLPLAHTFGCAFEFLFPFTLGCNITILTKTPSPQIITKAFQEIKPALILSVPLVIEKIYLKQILPVISRPIIRTILTIPLLNILILNKIRKKLTVVFGGNFREIVIGGAPLNHQAERFFKKMRFPYTVGYGMTECGPLISYASWKIIPLQSSGKVIDTLELKIDSTDQEKIAGEILIRGENVLDGYYKNEDATRAILDDEGWLHSGDLGIIDKKGFVFIKGRCKSMFLSANGRNIYPETIESVFSTKPGVAEVLVVQRKEKLVALVYPDKEYVEREKLTEDEIRELMEQNRKNVNSHLPQYINISSVELRSVEFEKTPKRSIRRFLYE